MAGRMGHVTATTQNLTVISADVENSIIAIKGTILARGGIVLVPFGCEGHSKPWQTVTHRRHADARARPPVPSGARLNSSVFPLKTSRLTSR